MPRIAAWDRFPPNVRQHLVERMRDRAISLADLNQLRLWVESQPEVPEGDWYKDFGSFKICGRGSYPKTFLLPGQSASIARLSGGSLSGGGVMVVSRSEDLDVY